MKLIRFGAFGEEKPGIMDANGDWLDVSAHVEDYNETFFAGDGLSNLQSWLDGNQSNLPKVDQNNRLGSPVARPSKIICIGLNYSDHAKETGAEVPAEPVLFYKASTALCGPFDNVEIPRKSQKTDWEVELCFVISKHSKYVSEADAASHIAGYAVMNDVSEREFQIERCGQWNKGKSHDTFAPMGPFLATPDEVENVENLDMHMDVNGERRQTGNTSTMVFKPSFLVHYISQFFTLLPGDIITTGTPPGVGMGMKPQVFLKAGDTMELGITELGFQKQTTVNA
jgi:2-keto-4-pentenoate hydratase/2-oxohepta-3-ene-1,7-dioic acid hydratase in catechol pathway